MKNKEYLYYISLFFSIFIIILMFIKIFSVETSITLSNTYADNIANIKAKIDMIGDGSCKDYLNDYMSYIEMGEFDGKVKISDLYNYMNSFDVMNMYMDGMNSCGISEEEIKNTQIPSKYLSILITDDSLMNKYIFNYEFGIKDNLSTLTETNTDNILYRSYMLNHLNIIDDYIDYYQNGGIYEE